MKRAIAAQQQPDMQILAFIQFMYAHADKRFKEEKSCFVSSYVERM